MLTTLTQTTQVISFQEAYQRFEHDLQVARENPKVNQLRARANGWSLGKIHTVDKPGQLCSRNYQVNTQDFTIKVSNNVTAPCGYAETFTLCLLSSEVKNYLRVDL